MKLQNLTTCKIKEVAKLYEKEMLKHLKNVGEKPIKLNEYKKILKDDGHKK